MLRMLFNYIFRQVHFHNYCRFDTQPPKFMILEALMSSILSMTPSYIHDTKNLMMLICYVFATQKQCQSLCVNMECAMKQKWYSEYCLSCIGHANKNRISLNKSILFFLNLEDIQGEGQKAEGRSIIEKSIFLFQDYESIIAHWEKIVHFYEFLSDLFESFKRFFCRNYI